MDRERINVGSIIVDEMLMNDIQEHTSLPFPVLITQFLRGRKSPFLGED